MNTNSNFYTIVYSAILVIVVAAALAFTAIVLKEPQEKNVEIEKKQNILMSFGKGIVPPGENKNTFIGAEYSKYIIDSYLVGVDGNVKEGKNGESAFTIDLKVQLATEADQRLLPVFVSKDEAGVLSYILPVRGTGLWGPIWGYVALADDWNTIVGAVFDHKGETPGLGAEISTFDFSKHFIGKQIFEGDRLVSVSVIKPGSAATTIHSVDGISGGTITSTGVSEMLRTNLQGYKAFLQNQQAANKVAPSTSEPTQEGGIDGENAGEEQAGSQPSGGGAS